MLPRSTIIQNEDEMNEFVSDLRGDAVARMDQGYRPEKNAFYSNDGMDLDVDKTAYSDAMYDWMQGQDRYADWDDATLKQFALDSFSRSSGENKAAEFWESSRIGWEQAKEDAEADRNTMLAEIEAFKQGINENYVHDVLTREKQYHDANIQNTLRQTQERLANMGRAASPYLLGHLQRRMEAQAADKLQLRRVELEQEVQRQKQVVLNQMQDVYGNTDRQMVDPATAAQIAKQLGAADAPTRVPQVGGDTDRNAGGGGGGGGGTVRRFSNRTGRESGPSTDAWGETAADRSWRVQRTNTDSMGNDWETSRRNPANTRNMSAFESIVM